MRIGIHSCRIFPSNIEQDITRNFARQRQSDHENVKQQAELLPTSNSRSTATRHFEEA
jgi:hypothetical protein